MTSGGALRAWVEVASGSDFPIQNLPFGIFENDFAPRAGVAVGKHIFDLKAAAEAGLFDGFADRELFSGPVLNSFMEAGEAVWRAVRQRLVELLREGTPALNDVNREAFLVRQDAARMRVPFASGDYVDFYSSLEHATNLGKILRPGSEPLLPNWRWLPIGYHGRCSTIVCDGAPIVRPRGQRKSPQQSEPAYGPTQALDIELEMGFVTGPGNEIGEPILIANARKHIFGFMLLNDWSARDIQAWEYQPLGPFLGKSFATSVSPWIVTLDALEPFAVPAPEQDPAPLEYLRDPTPHTYDITLIVELQTRAMGERGIEAVQICRTNFKYLYWTVAQQLAHATSNGTATRPGDLYASGTISGESPQSYGSLIELTWRGARPLRLPSGETRGFLEDGDTVTFRGYCEKPDTPRIGFGTLSATILPARP